MGMESSSSKKPISGAVAEPSLQELLTVLSATQKILHQTLWELRGVASRLEWLQERALLRDRTPPWDRG
jgi:hypothetical protein